MIDYVANGLRVMFVDNCGGALDCGSGPAMTGGAERILILMPAERPGSIGDLVAKGVQRFGVAAIPFGVAPSDGSRDEEIFELMREQSVTSILATPQAALRLAQISNAGHYAKGSADASGIMIRDSRLRGNDNVAVDDEESGSADASGIMTRDSRRSLSCAKSQGGNDKRFPRSLLLSGDYVSPAVRDEIERLWDCKVYEHYGMTEMGLGGAMSCEIREGYHIREADLYIEIINPHTGEPVPDGEFGEIVFTTLTRQAMPLIRYRTGDISRIIPSPCPCGSVPRRLERVGSRGQTKDY
jgi:phenylacetate-coenzyme A ligase PaaK-like adenylate-forming protein